MTSLLPGSSAAWLRVLAACSLLLAALFWSLAAYGQDLVAPGADQPVALVADSVTVDRDTNTVTAEGNVEVFYGERTLTAKKIVYNDTTGRIFAEGDLVLRDPAGVTVFADTAELDVDLRDGLVRGAKSVFRDHIKLSAVEARRTEKRFNTLSKAVYSPCIVCPDSEVPLWRIRARRIIHDEQEKIIHYENATFDVFGVSVAWLPYFRHPDPTVERASGFLVPSFLSSSTFGYAVKQPYFLVLDDHSDFTFTPFITTNDGLILEGEYRKAFVNGDLRLAGSATVNDYDDRTKVHGHLDSEGLFDLSGVGLFRLDRSAQWGWDITFATDDAYLSRFDFDEFGDRLTSELFIERYAPDGFFDVSGLYFQSLRDDEPAGNIPLALPVVDARLNIEDLFFGGQFGLSFSAQALSRNEGRDQTRISLGVDWERREITGWGLEVVAFGEARGDFFGQQDDPTVSRETSFRITGLAGLEARFPLVTEPSSTGVMHVFEPIVQAIVAPYGGNGAKIPIEDSLVTEFDETNVIDRNHFSGLDSFEEGPRINLAVRYRRLVDEGVEFDASLGRVYRFRTLNAFSSGSGLRDSDSDFVAAWSLSYAPFLTIQHRLRFEGDATITRNEFFGTFALDPVELNARYIFLESDAAIGAPEDREEVEADAALQIDNNWSMSAFMQRDLRLGEFVQVGGSLTYENECCAVDLFLKRRFTDQEDSPASTSVGLRVRLLTLGDSNDR